MQKHLSATFGMPVKFACDAHGKGRITFPFNTESELERIITLFDRLKDLK